MSNRVVITGLGVVSPLGCDTDTFWRAALEGRCGIGPIESFSTAELSVHIGAEIRDFDPGAHFERQQLAVLDRFSQLGLVAAREAIAASGLDTNGEVGREMAVIVGTGGGGLGALDEGYERLYGRRSTRLHPFTVPRYMPSAVAGHISTSLGIQGPTFVVASACASSNHAIGNAFHLVRSGAVVAAVTGGTEAPLTPGSLQSWAGLRVMADDTCRPFSAERRGMVLGEGAGMLVLESLEHARRRDAPIRAEVLGFGMTADAEDLLLPSPDGAGRAVAAALRDARLDAGQVDYVSAHGTGTAANDSIETRVLHRVFGAAADRLWISSLKSMVGHSLGAAGALEAVATTLTLEQGVVHPTVNYLAPDPECDLDYVANEARSRNVRVAVSNAFAFGGLNAVLALARFDDASKGGV